MTSLLKTQRSKYPVYTEACNENAPDVLVHQVLTPSEAQEVEDAAGELGPDKGSGIDFIRRNRNLVFILRAGDRWIQIEQDFLNIASQYNGTKGGYRRFFRGMPDSFLDGPAVLKAINAFADHFGVPDGQVVLLLIQTSVITPQDEGKCTTGDGIHCDGVDVCMLSVLRRENVKGTRSAAFLDPEGTQPLFTPRVLQPGECMFWRDNRVYHYVEPARLVDKSKPGYRTVLVMGYPGIHQVIGINNPNNTLPPSGLHPSWVEVRKE